MLGDYKDKSLADQGVRRIEWADEGMPVLASIRREWERERPLEGVRIAACLHVTTETANLMRTLQAGGAQVALCASNPLSTQDDVAAALGEVYKIPAFAVRGEDADAYYRHIHAVLDTKPQITMDDGADLVHTLHKERRDVLEGVTGGTEETTTGVIRLRAMAAEGVLRYPIIAVNDAKTKHMFDNQHGVGQSALDGFFRATNRLVAGRVFVSVGYGWCGRGLAQRARGMGARVIVVEVDAVRALEAVMDGFEVMSMADAAALGDVFVTVTGNKHVIDRAHFERLKDGAMLANAGHFDIEINLTALKELAVEERELRPYVREYKMADGRRIRVLAEGRLLNLAAAEGHPAEVMDMSFANQALAVRKLVQEQGSLELGVHGVPAEIDDAVARLKLTSMGVTLEELTDDQKAYLSSYHIGT